MCELLNFVTAPLWEILKSAIGIALGTTLATVLVWLLLIGPILRDNERRRKHEEILAKALQLARGIDSSFDDVRHQLMSRQWAQEMSDKVNELVTHVKQTIKATMPELADALDAAVNRVVANTVPLNAFLKPDVDDKLVAEWVRKNVGQIEVLRTDCQDLIRTVSAHQRENIQRLLPQDILDRFKDVRGRLCQRCSEKQR